MWKPRRTTSYKPACSVTGIASYSTTFQERQRPYENAFSEDVKQFQLFVSVPHVNTTTAAASKQRVLDSLVERRQKCNCIYFLLRTMSRRREKERGYSSVHKSRHWMEDSHTLQALIPINR
jgi:hypothetical protein